MSNVYGVGQDDAYRTLVQVDDAGEITYEASIATRATAQFGQRLGGEYSPPSLSWGTPRRKKDSDLQAMLSRFIILAQKHWVLWRRCFNDAKRYWPLKPHVDGMAGFNATEVLEGAVDIELPTFKMIRLGHS